MLVKIKDVKKDYLLGKTTVTALKGIDLTIDKGEFLSIVGPSGSGKTTLLNLIGCLDSPTSGTLLFEGKDLNALSAIEATMLRRYDIGFIFQTFNLIPVLTAFENIELPLILTKKPKAERKEIVEGWLEKVGILEFKDHKPEELSGGQRQRVSIARALISNSKLVLADEPTANLDHETGEHILELMAQMNKEIGTTFVFSTHDPKVMAFAGRKVVLEDGKITSDRSG